VVTDGAVPEADLRAVYQRIDYVLIPATVEGGPLSLLEGLAMGKPVIAPEGVGLVPEFGAAAPIRRYPAGDAEALARLVTACYEEKLAPGRLVRERTWDRWAEAHHRVFLRLLGERGQALPEPAPGFRFGMMGELDLPRGVRVDGLEATVDQAAAHLFHGRYEAARASLSAVLAQYPFAEKLLATIPRDEGAPVLVGR
jgi:hypothetical protein